jgi:DNA mismatch repair protein MutS2
MNERTNKILEFDKIVSKLAGLTVSSLGRSIAESLQPQTDFRTIESSLKETDDGVAFLVRKGSPPFGGIHDIRGSMKRVDMGAVLNPGELLHIADTLRACRNLKNYASDNVVSGAGNTVSELISCLEINRRIEEKISSSILNEEEISDNASTTLSNIRRQIRDMQNSIREKLNSIIKSAKNHKYMQESIVTLRGDRYVVPVKQEYRNEIPGLIHDSSSSGATIFVEPMAVVEANNSIKQLKIKEQIEIERILGELTEEVRSISDSLKSNVSLLARLDFIFAKARLSTDFKCVCPKLNNEKRIIVKKGRHPLLDQKAVVPIDFWIGNEFSTLVITGPNTGGKTVTLKTVGLFTLMAQAGLHIPANEGTDIGVFEKVFADIGDEQSIEQSLSTFSSHMKNIVKVLESADDRSLTLFDELGAGTDPTEGAALATAILENLRQRGAISVATTHYSELKVYAISNEGVENACCEFDVETLKPTYRLLIGVPGKSNAFAISKRLGLPEIIIEKAKGLLTQEDIKFEDMLMQIENNRSQAESEKTKAEVLRLEIEALRNELNEKVKKVESQKDKMIREAREEARKILLEAKAESEEMISEMKRLQMEMAEAERNKAAEEIRLKIKNKINKIEDSLSEAILPKKGYTKPPEGLKPGDTVLIININQKGTVVTPPDKDGQALIQAGIMKINVHITNLKLVNEQVGEVKSSGTGRMSAKSRNITTEIDLRGMSLGEATEAVDKYLDDASMAGLKEVTIIHGKGTGVLRNGIHQFLKTNSHVSSFRLGKYGEGESGVTVVEMK